MSKRLLFITPIFPQDLSEDKVVPFIFHFTQQFGEDKNVTIDVISLMYPFSSKPYKINNITVYPIGSRFRKSIRKIPFLCKGIYKGIQLCRKNEYDGVLCFWYRESALVGKIVSGLFRKELIVWMLGQDINKDNAYLKLLKIPKEKLVMISLQQSEHFYENHKIIVGKIADVAISRNLFPEFNSGERKIDILGVGNLGALKNYTLFIEILSKLENKNLNAVIIGEGEELEKLKAKANQYGLTNNILFTGALSHKEVLNYMNNAKVFLHTSKSEGSGTVLQEALYSGCQVVSTIAVEKTETLEQFYFSTNQQELTAKISIYLNHPIIPKRIEHFKMEDTISTIYNSFYKD
ncbi:glycosyltransferase family 4 protein [Flavobacterium sp. IMCC34852]|uniref:Glycosyltransferase family 4 protein n=1 Tax=Flavobacterium rivulicola TaxID=2732161 RepID=A0A7Y3VY57_9FLAO|nr:glycosyltransferase [Flavobacterium sp. IMCC34852]NNT71328.1 glycosyltransferase family 4 protein [Flavobacterium sp. IMCC34852]